MKVISCEWPGGLALQSRYSPAVVRHCKSTPGMCWRPTENVWSGYRDAVACVVEKLQKEGITVDCTILDGVHSLAASLGASSSLLPLHGYQKDALDFIANNSRDGCILALDPGLGKTRCALEHIRLSAIEKWAVVCPAYVCGVWRAEIEKWAPELCNRVSIVSYDSLHKVSSTIDAAGMILDECHLLVEERSRRSQACRELREKCSEAIGLTGTPLTGKLKAAWNVIDLLSPGRLGTFFKFGLRYCDGHTTTVPAGGGEVKAVWEFLGCSHEDELAARFKHFVFRRTRSEVAADLPAKTRQVLRLDVDVPRLTLPSLTPALFRTVMDAVVDKKLPEALRVIEGHAESGANVVVFTYRKSVAEKIAAELAAAGHDSWHIHGDIPPEKRVEMLKTPPQVLVATIDSCGVGISLTHATVFIFVEFCYEAWKMAQAEARGHRLGQAHPVLIQYLLAAGSVEENVVDTLVEKLETSAAVIGAEDSGLREDLAAGGESESEAFAAIAASLLQ